MTTVAELHALCCDCDLCLGPGVPAVPGSATPTPEDKPPRRRLALNERLAEALREEDQALARSRYFRGVVRALSAREGGQ